MAAYRWAVNRQIVAVILGVCTSYWNAREATLAVLMLEADITSAFKRQFACTGMRNEGSPMMDAVTEDERSRKLIDIRLAKLARQPAR